MKRIVLFSILCCLLCSCGKKYYVCVLGDTILQKKIPSSIKISKKFRIADTTVVHISGTIYGSNLDTTDTFEDEDVLPFSNVILKDMTTQEVFGKVTSLDGSYSFTVPAATYQLEVQYVDFNRVIVDSIRLSTGELFQLSAHLGIGIDKEYFTIETTQFDRKIIRNTD